MTKAAGEYFAEEFGKEKILMFSRASYVALTVQAVSGSVIITLGGRTFFLTSKCSRPQICAAFFTAVQISEALTKAQPRDLVLRFLALGVFTPLMRDHAAEGTREQECYQFENIEDFRSVINTRYRLIPYLYSEYMKAALNDDMYFKPLGFVYPDDKMAIRVENQLMLGNENYDRTGL